MAVVSEGKCPECGRKVSLLTSTGAKVSRCPRCGAILKESASPGSTLGIESSLDRFGSQSSALLQDKGEEKSPTTVAKERAETKTAPAPKASGVVDVKKEEAVPPKPSSPPAQPKKAPAPAKPVVSEKKAENKEAAADLTKTVVEKKTPDETTRPVAEVASAPKPEPAPEPEAAPKPEVAPEAAPKPTPEPEPEPKLQATKGESLERLDRFVTETLARQVEPEKGAGDDTQVVEEPGEPAPDEEVLTAAKKDLSALAAEYAAAEDASTETLSADLSRIVAQIDKLFGPGYASQHPELITAALQTQQATSASADIIKRLERFEDRLARLEALLKEGR